MKLDQGGSGQSGRYHRFGALVIRRMIFKLSNNSKSLQISFANADSFQSCVAVCVGSRALRPAASPYGNLRSLIAQTPLPRATRAYGQLPERDFNPIDKRLLLRTVKSRFVINTLSAQGVPIARSPLWVI